MRIERLPVPDHCWVRQFGRREGGIVLLELRVRRDRTPDTVFNRSPGIGGEGQAPREGQPHDRTLQADATGLQGLVEGQLTQRLPAYDGLGKAFVVCYQPAVRLSAQPACAWIN